MPSGQLRESLSIVAAAIKDSVPVRRPERNCNLEIETNRSLREFACDGWAQKVGQNHRLVGRSVGCLAAQLGRGRPATRIKPTGGAVCLRSVPPPLFSSAHNVSRSKPLRSRSPSRNKQNPAAVSLSLLQQAPLKYQPFVNQEGKLDLAAVAARNWPQSRSNCNHTGGCN